MDMNDANLTEAQWQAQVIDYAHLRGFRVIHNTDSRRTQPGVPDLMLIKPPRLLFVELKSETGKVRPEQRQMISDLRACGQLAAVYRPSHFPILRALLDEREARA
jgi:hypothetical protein